MLLYYVTGSDISAQAFFLSCAYHASHESPPPPLVKILLF